MDRIFLLMLGTVFVLGGLFGIVETAIRAAKRRPGTRPASAELLDEGPSLAPTDEDLEVVVVRERETNPDGRARQDIIGALQIGDPVALLPETPRTDGRNEIRVVADGGTIGYVPSAKVAKVLDMLNDGAQMHSEVSHIAETDEQKGVWINISVWR